MSQEQWTAVDNYFSDHLIPSDPIMEAALKDSNVAGLPQANVAPNQGKLLYLLAKIHRARKILEIGTLGGYSTLWFARALPEGGTIITLEYEPDHAKVAEVNIARAGFADVVDIRVGKAIEMLPKLADEGHDFDLFFIDADKKGNPDYFQWALKMSHPGSLIIVDNVVRDGSVIDADSSDPSVIGTRKVIEMVGAESRVDATAVQTVGSKGYDGFALILVTGE